MLFRALLVTIFVTAEVSSFVLLSPSLRVTAKESSLSSSLVMAAIEPTRAGAAQQVDEYYAMAPWEKMPRFEWLAKLGRPTTLDVRAFIPGDRNSVVLPGIYVTQDGMPGINAGAGRERFWRPVGAIAAYDEASLDSAVARQRELIVAWAAQALVDLKTEQPLLKLGAGDPPVRIAWAYKTSFSQWAMHRMTTFSAKDEAYEGELNEVPPETPIDESVRCGFLGTPSRPVKTERGLLSFTKVELPE